MTHPYSGKPSRQFWKREPGLDDPALLDPVSPPKFQISPKDRVVTAGSCFAQHVARALSAAGFRHHITERAHPIVPRKLAEAHHYGMFSARYGNVYTARQLRQLINRAYGTYVPVADAWSGQDRFGVIDPFRPQIQPGGFLDVAELSQDRRQHLLATRRAFEDMDVFIFTLGLTEAWLDRRDGAVFPLAPGVVGGEEEAANVEPCNFDEVQVYEDLLASIRFLLLRRPQLRIILTVSPVPLNATFEDRHVLVSTTWSKAVLRIAAEKCAQTIPQCAYFPSYEIITSPHVRGRYYAPDRREVTPEGVDHVMGLFLKHYGAKDVAPKTRARDRKPKSDTHHAAMQRAMDLLCDEAAIDGS